MRAIVLLAVFSCVPVFGQVSSDMSVGVWPWLVGNIDGQTASIIQQVQSTGHDTIYLHLYRTTGPEAGTLYMVDESGTFPASLGSISPLVTLTNFIAQAHAAHLQVIGVVNCFLDGGPLPGDTAHEDHLLAVIDHLVHSSVGSQPRYALDGIALDRVRFYQGTSNPASVVTNFVSRVRNLIGILPLHAFLPANLYHIDGPPYTASFRTYASAMSLLSGQYGHDWEALAPLLDVNLPMAYIAEAGLYGNNTAWMQAYLDVVAQYAQQARSNAGVPTQRILPAVRAWNDSTGTTTPASLAACIQGALLAGAEGTMMFRYFTALGQTSWWNTIASYATPGQDLPLAAATSLPLGGLSVRIDAGGSSSMNPNALPLTFAFDLDDDGTLDTPFTTTATHDFALSQAGSAWVGVKVRDALGNEAVRKHRVTVVSNTLALGGFLSAIGGGTVTLSLNVGPAAAGHSYVLLGSLSGASPATPLPGGLLLPLAVDDVTWAILDLSNTPLFPGFIGLLDANGSAQGALASPPGLLPSALAWTTLTFAAVSIPPGGGSFSHASNSKSILIFP